MANTLRELWRDVRKDRRYVVVAVLFVLLLLSGSRITGEPGITGKAVTNPVWQAEYELTPKEPLVELQGALTSRQGDFYRLVLSVQDMTTALDQGSGQEDTLGNEEAVHYLRVFARSRAGQTMEVGRVRLSKDREVKEMVFRTDGTYSDLVLENEVANRNADIFAKVVSLTRLNVSTEEEAKLLKPTLVGEVSTPSEKTEMSDKSSVGIYDFKKKGELAGQVFKATAGQVASVELKLEFIGNGGLGTYELGLYEAKKSGERFVIDEMPMTIVQFDAVMARTKYMSLYRPGVYLFPLSANVVKDNYYFVGIKNKASFNKGNNLRFDGVETTKAYAEGVGVAGVSSRGYKEIGTLFFRINYARPKQVGDLVLAPNSLTQDLGGGVGQYAFSTRNNYLGRLASRNLGKNSVTYELSLVYAVKKFRLEASLEGEEGSNPPAYKMEYSFDSKTWQAIGLGGRTTLYATNIRQVIDTADGGERLFIRVSAIDPTREIRVADLSVTADVIVR